MPSIRAVSVGVIALIGTVQGMASAAPAAPRPPRPAVLTDRAVAELPAAEQAGRLQPLRRVAAGLATRGTSRASAAYAGVRLDADTDTVDLFVTDPAAGRDIVSAARQADPDAAWARVRVRRAPYSRATLTRAARVVMAHASTAGVVAVSVPADGGGLDLGVVRAGPATRAAVTGNVPVPMAVAVRRPTVTKSWADVKWHDRAPFIGGDVLTAGGHGYCTAGLPAVQRGTGRQVLVTAAHCFALGSRVYTAGGATRSYGSGATGSYVGTVTRRTTQWDAETLVGSTNNADESDTSRWLPMTSVGYSYEGDYVCQDGQASYYLGHPTPCGIKVTDGDIWFRIGGYWARGVEGVDVLHGWGSHNGDSGATVFAVERGGVRQARGIVSSGGLDGTPDQKRVDWTEAVDIFAADNLILNPRT